MRAPRFIALLAALALGTPAPSRAADITVDIEAYAIAGWIRGAIGSFIESEAPEFAWAADALRVELSGSGQQKLHFRLNLSFEGLPFMLDADVVEYCNDDGPHLQILSPEVTTFIEIPDDTLADLTDKANRMIEARTSEIIDPIWERLAKPTLGGIHRVCPHVTVGASGDVRADFDFVNGCIDGDSDSHECAAGSRGTGVSRTCENGLWNEYRDCERIPGPGQHEP